MSRQLLLDKISTDKQFSPKALLQLNAIWQHGTHVRALRRAINRSYGKIVHPAHFLAAQFRTDGRAVLLNSLPPSGIEYRRSHSDLT
jgi:hypothetical protein